eukprot:2729730-Pleurochrysis_carterae.AAC.2
MHARACSGANEQSGESRQAGGCDAAARAATARMAKRWREVIQSGAERRTCEVMRACTPACGRGDPTRSPTLHLPTRSRHLSDISTQSDYIYRFQLHYGRPLRDGFVRRRVSGLAASARRARCHPLAPSLPPRTKECGCAELRKSMR